MVFEMFYKFSSEKQLHPSTKSFYSMVEKMRFLVNRGDSQWRENDNLRKYAQICFWGIRKQEYDFIIRSWHQFATSEQPPLRVLDVGCGVVPLGNWISMQGHKVFAIDPNIGDLNTLVSYDFNSFYGSDVQYLNAEGEHVPLPANSFDIVLCTSVIEHLVPGYDRMMLWEIARILKPGGMLLMTFDIAPADAQHAIESELGEGMRLYASPFDHVTLKRLVKFIEPYFEIEASAIPRRLGSLSWNDVHDYWRSNQEHDGREGSPRDYLAMGCSIRRRQALPQLLKGNLTSAALEARNALMQAVRYYQAHSENRMQIISEQREKNLSLGRINERQSYRFRQLQEVLHRAEQELITKSMRVYKLEEHLQIRNEELQQTRREWKIFQDEIREARKKFKAKVKRLRSIQNKLEESLDTKDKQLHQQMEELIAKENIIQQFKGSLYFWLRNAPIIRSGDFRKVIDRLREIKKRFEPRLGILAQHPPISLKIPTHYSKVIKKDPLQLLNISVVTPSYNQAVFLDRTIRSLADQNYPKLEYIVQDGLSTDKTPQVVRDHPEVVTAFNTQSDTGQAQAINRGFRQTSGEIMAYLNSDDILLPGALYFVSDYFRRHPKVDVVYSHRIIINEHDLEIGRWILPPHSDKVLFWADFVPQETLFWRRSIWEKIGAELDESMQFAMDWDMILRYIISGATIIRVPRFLAAFRVHASQKTSAQLNQIGLKEMDAVRAKYLTYCPGREEIHQNLKSYLKRSVLYHFLWKIGFLPT